MSWRRPEVTFGGCSGKESRVWMVLDHRLQFPDPRGAVDVGSLNGLVAVGGDLSVDRLLLAYRNGIFPWSVNPITWWSPEPRGVMELDGFHLGKNLAKVVRRGRFRVTFNQAFQKVLEACAQPAPGRTSTWISPEFIEAYGRLHRLGHAHSVECWQSDELVGGVYGVQVGGLFSGESMFHRVSDASKVALYYLVERLRTQGFGLLDVQTVTPHTQSLGAIAISRMQYLERLARAVLLRCEF